MRVVVLGATGFLGSHAVPILAAAGHEVVAVSRHGGAGTGSVAMDVTASDADLARLVEGADCVVNLVGIKTEKGGARFQAAHADLPARLVAAMRESSVRRLVHVSALVDRPRHAYHRTKLAGDEAVRSSGLEWTLLRPAVVWGRGDDFVRNLDAVIAASRVVPVPRGAGPLRPVWVGDVARAIAAAVARAGAYDLVGPDEAPLEHWVRLVAAATGRKANAVPVPRLSFRPAAALIERLTADPLVTAGQAELLAGGMSSASDGLARLGLAARRLDEAGVREALAGPRKRPPLRLRR